MLNKLADAYGPADTMRLSYEAGAGVKELKELFDAQQVEA